MTSAQSQAAKINQLDTSLMPPPGLHLSLLHKSHISHSSPNPTFSHASLYPAPSNQPPTYNIQRTATRFSSPHRAQSNSHSFGTVTFRITDPGSETHGSKRTERLCAREVETGPRVGISEPQSSTSRVLAEVNEDAGAAVRDRRCCGTMSVLVPNIPSSVSTAAD